MEGMCVYMWGVGGGGGGEIGRKEKGRRHQPSPFSLSSPSDSL